MTNTKSATSTETTNKWKPVKDFTLADGVKVDLWFYIYASPRSMGMSDAFKVESAWRAGGKWFHVHEGKDMELYSDYVTHWSPIPSPSKPPRSPKVDLW